MLLIQSRRELEKKEKEIPCLKMMTDKCCRYCCDSKKEDDATFRRNDFPKINWESPINFTDGKYMICSLISLALLLWYAYGLFCMYFFPLRFPF